MYLLKIKNKIFATQEYLKKLTISLVWCLKMDRSNKMYDSCCWEKVNISQ